MYALTEQIAKERVVLLCLLVRVVKTHLINGWSSPD